MASASKKESVNRNLRSVLITEKAGVALSRLQGEYQTLLGEIIPFREFGFPSLEAYLKSIPSVVSLRRGPTGELMCAAVADETTKHIASLVSRQKGKKTKGRGLRSKPGRSYAHPTYAMSKARPAGKIYTSRFVPKTGKYNTSFRPASAQQPKSVRYNHLSKPAFTQQTQTVKHNVIRQKERTAPPTGKMHTQQPRPTAAQQSKPTAAQQSRPSAVQQSKPTAAQQPRAADGDTKLLVPTATQLPNPGPWSGKLGSKRGQQPAKTTAVDTTLSSNWKPADDWKPTNSPSSKPVHENIHVTIPKDGTRQVNSQASKPVHDNIHVTISNNGHRQTEVSPQKPKGKGRPGKTIKPEWSANFEVPPRFKRLVSPTGTTTEGFHNTPESSSTSDPSPPDTVSQPSSTSTNKAVSNKATEKYSWIQTVLSEKPNGLWSSALCDMHLKEFDQPLDTNIIEQMSKLSLLEKESISNSDILYPTQTGTATVSSASETNGHLKEKKNAEHGDQTGNGTAQSSPSLPEEDTPSEGYSSPTLGIPSSLSEPSSRPPSTEAPCGRPPSTEAPSSLGEPCEEGYSSPTSETYDSPSEPSYEGSNSPTIDAPGMPSLVLPEENKWDLYVAYIKSLSDFHAILIGEDYSEQLIILEEAMRSFYQCSAWVLTEPPEVGLCYAAEFNREWLRVQVTSVEDQEVKCFLLDHGDIENAAISSLRPLAEKFLQLPFQVIHCKLSQCEQVAHDDKTALQMFCQLALGQSLLAEVVSRDGDRIVMELFDSSDVSILEQCMTAGI